MNETEGQQRPLSGSCLCGEITYQVSGPLLGVLNCHCSMCRKSHGAAFRTRAALRSNDFRWLSGEELLTRYESSKGEFRVFCSICSSNLITEFDADKDWIGFALGTLDDDPGVAPTCHVMVNSKAPWFHITDELKQWGELPIDEK